ncbi:MAG: glycosyltransferase family 4 protein [Flavobacteriales bacterium]
MKLGFDAKRAFFNNTGLGNYSRDTIRILGQYFSDNEYHLYTPKEIKNERLSFLEDKKHFYIHSPIAWFDRTFSSLWRTIKLKNDLVKDGISHFHGLSHELPYGIQNTNIKTVVSIHDLIAIRYPQYFKKVDRISYVKKSQYACQIADKIIAVSQQTKEDIIRFFNIEEDKIEVIYQGCNKVFQEEQSADFKISVSTKHQLPKKYLLYVGTIEERKNLYNLLRCLKELPDYQLVVIGNGKAYKNKCLDFINENKMNDRIKILSDLSLKEMAAIYQQADIMIYPSFFEGFGIPILESLFCGVPVITSQGGCFAEPGGKYSSYINPNDIEQMKSEIVDISTNISRRKKMIEEGKKHAQNFTDDKIAERLMNLYQNI